MKYSWIDGLVNLQIWEHLFFMLSSLFTDGLKKEITIYLSYLLSGYVKQRNLLQVFV